MRTTLNLDERALAEAMKAAPGETKTAVINQALQEFAKRHKVRELLDLEGKFSWEGDLEELRKRRRRRDESSG